MKGLEELDICPPPSMQLSTWIENFPAATQKKYSLAKALLEGNESLSGLEKEVSQEISLKTNRTPQGFFLPTFALTRDLTAGFGPQPSAGTAGQGFVPLTTEPSLIEALYPFTFSLQAGAKKFDNLTGNVSLPRQTTANTMTWAAEGAQIARTAGAYDQVQAVPHRAGVVTAYSKQLLAQSTIDVDNIVKQDILRVMGVGIDRAVLNGTGAANNPPTGILTYTANTVGNYNINLRAPNQTFGGPATYNALVQFAGALEDANFENDGTFCFIVPPKVKARWKVIAAAVNYPRYLWEGRPGRNACALGQYGGYTSKLLDESLAGQVLFAKWSECLIFNWSGIDIITDPFTLADWHQIRVVIHMLMDVEWRHIIAACASVDSGAQ